MKYIVLCLIVTVAAVVLFEKKLRAQSDIFSPNSLVVVELFTSQSCSSCPPADALLVEIADNPNIIALGCHVSYWNHLHWKDTLSHDFCDMRQHGYAASRGTKRIYTPQMIVNGETEFVGSHRSKLNLALSKAQASPIQRIDVGMSGEDIVFNLPAIAPYNYRLWAYGYKRNVHQKIGSGENGGRAVTYARPVMSYTNLGPWDGQGHEGRFVKPEAEIDGIVILAQKDGYSAIVAAGRLGF